MKILILACTILSVLNSNIYAEELKSTKIRSSICEKILFKAESKLNLVQEESIELLQTCLDESNMEVVKKLTSDVLEKTIGLEIQVNLKSSSLSQVNALVYASKAVSFDRDGNLILKKGWELSFLNLEIKDLRSSYELLISSLEKTDFDKGGFVTDKFNLEDFDLEALKKRAQFYAEKEYVTTKWDDMVVVLEDFAYDTNLLEVITNMKSNHEIMGVIVEVPNYSCQDSENCSYASFTLYLNNGQFVSVKFDFRN